ncbi:membrane protein [Mycobacterium tuberculosis]|nr:membrane protein [Mycobacterium tuberculosis]
MHNAAEALHRQFNQEAVLTFDYLPQNAPEADAILITVPDIGIARFRDAFPTGGDWNATTIAHGRREFVN